MPVWIFAESAASIKTAGGSFSSGRLEPMGFYAKYVLPRFIDLSIRNRETAGPRAEYIPQARGDVLEVGHRLGLEFAFLFIASSASLWAGAFI